MKNSNILIIDDNKSNIELLSTILEDAEYRSIKHFTDARMALESILQAPPDLVLLDIRMPHLSGLDILGALRQQPLAPFPVVMVLTALVDRETRLQALELGAADFINKPFDPGEVLKRIANILQLKSTIRNLNDESQALQAVINQKNEELRSLALIDSATGLPNRRSLIININEVLSLKKHVAIYFIVADDVEDIAHAHGYPVAEKFIRVLGDLVKQSPILMQGTVGCWGNRELAIVQHCTAHFNPEPTALRLLRLLTGDCKVDDLLLTTSVRIGTVVSDGYEIAGEELLRKSAAALPPLFTSHVRAYEKRLDDDLARRHEIRRALKNCISMGELSLVFQPKLSLNDAKLTGAEVLLRWNSESLGAIPPDSFIPLAEESGDIFSIGEWVINESLRIARAWEDADLLSSEFTMAINVSSRQLQRPGFAEFIISRIEALDISPLRIRLEITESGFISDLPAVSELLKGIRKNGVGISIDDFGTGYSSLSYLKSLPVNELKIDKIFIAELENNPEDQKLIETIIAIAHVFNCSVVAEGIETPIQLEMLKKLGCDQGQGYLFSYPMGSVAFEKFINNYIQF